MDLAQKLYESKLLTYPRTDSRFLCSDMEQSTLSLVATTSRFLGIGTDLINISNVINDAKVSDHHAIIPTGEIGKTRPDRLPETERNILALVSIRLLCAVIERHEYEAVTAEFDCMGHIFTAKGKRTTKDGWKGMEAKFTESLNEANPLPFLSEGQEFDALAEITSHHTLPPKPYTEDTLLLAMETAGAKETTNEAERKGLGTPATRAAIIEKLVSSGFIIRKGRQLIPTQDGENLIRMLPDELKSPTLTAEWENALALIAKCKAEPEQFMQGIAEMVQNLVAKNFVPKEEYIQLFRNQAAIGACPRCGSDVLEGKRNFYCANRDCKFALWRADRFFTSKKSELTKEVATELLKHGKAKVKGLYSEKKNKTYDAIIQISDTGTYVNYRFVMNRHLDR